MDQDSGTVFKIFDLNFHIFRHLNSLLIFFLNLEFYGQVNTVKVISSLSINLLTLFLGRFSSLSSFQKGGKNNLTRVSFSENVSIPLKPPCLTLSNLGPGVQS